MFLASWRVLLCQAMNGLATHDWYLTSDWNLFNKETMFSIWQSRESKSLILGRYRLSGLRYLSSASSDSLVLPISPRHLDFDTRRDWKKGQLGSGKSFSHIAQLFRALQDGHLRPVLHSSQHPAERALSGKTPSRNPSKNCGTRRFRDSGQEGNQPDMQHLAKPCTPEPVSVYHNFSAMARPWKLPPYLPYAPFSTACAGHRMAGNLMVSWIFLPCRLWFQAGGAAGDVALVLVLQQFQH